MYNSCVVCLITVYESLSELLRGVPFNRPVQLFFRHKRRDHDAFPISDAVGNNLLAAVKDGLIHISQLSFVNTIKRKTKVRNKSFQLPESIVRFKNLGQIRYRQRLRINPCAYTNVSRLILKRMWAESEPKKK